MPAYNATYLTVATAQAGRRLDNFLLSFIKGVPYSHIYKLIRSGQVRVNSGRVSANYRVVVGDRVRVPPLRAAEKRIRKPSPALCDVIAHAIFYKSDRMIALDKPAGETVHSGARNPCGIIEVLNHLYPAEEEGGWHLVYRLDKDVTGCLLAVKGVATKRQLQAHWHDVDCRKIYRLAVYGAWPWQRRSLTGTIGKTEVGGEYIMRPMGREEGGKSVKTDFRRLNVDKNFSLLEAELRTGRTHQIRSQCAFAGHPIVGDRKYAFLTGRNVNPREPFLALHCYKIELPLALHLPRHEFISPARNLQIEKIIKRGQDA